MSHASAATMPSNPLVVSSAHQRVDVDDPGLAPALVQFTTRPVPAGTRLFLVEEPAQVMGMPVTTFGSWGRTSTTIS